MTSLIQFRDFSFQYDSQQEPTLHNINLTIEQGEKVLLAGPSGSGKTTLLNMLGGMDACSSGTIMLDGEPDQGRRAITLVPDTHVIVLRASQIYATVPEAVTILAEHPERATTWIAGPSATSDIELIRVDGVHGPRNLRVIIVDDKD